MKSSVSRKDLKSLVKECVREVMFEEGIISDLVSEIAAGFAKANLLEAKQTAKSNLTERKSNLTERVVERKQAQKVERPTYTENKKNLTDTLKKNFRGIDLFEGTTPAPAADSNSSLSGVSSDDSGIDISAIPGMNNWKHLIK